MTGASGGLRCYGWCEGAGRVTHIGEKGYTYCDPCTATRRQSGCERVRALAVWERKVLERGERLAQYAPISKREHEKRAALAGAP